MSNSLVIVESPAKAKTISRILGKEYTVLASMGHIRDLPTSKLGVDVDDNFKPDYVLNKNRKKVIDELKKASKSAEHIYLAPDPDREGEAIAWHLHEVLKKISKATFKRVTFHEITASAINEAMEVAHEVDTGKVDAQQARRVLDRIVGYKVSPILWRRGDGAKSAGRVQTVALRLICEREKAILAFTPVEYWSLKAEIAKQKETERFTVQLARLNNEKPVIPNAEMADQLEKELETALLKVTDLKSKIVKRNPSPPFITSTLQQAASGALRLSPNQTMRVAQQLYEGMDVGSGDPVGLITYMRTDSVNLAKEAVGNARNFIGSEYGSEYLPASPKVYKTKNSAQEAHEAIRPTNVDLTPKKLAKYLDADQLKLYTLIWRRFVACQMTQAQFRQNTLELDAQGKDVTFDYLFRATVTENVFPGYLKVYDVKEEDEEEDENAVKNFPKLEIGDLCDIHELLKKQHFTEPPPRFSEASLIKQLEANGVGRPSTYASIVNTIQERDYVDKDKGKLFPTKVGMDVCDYLVLSLPDLFEVQFTAHMEDKLDTIESGSLAWTDMLGSFYTEFIDWVKKAKTAGAPPAETFLRVIALFNDSVKYEEPRKVGRRTYDDKKYLGQLTEAIEKEEELSGKQWTALVSTAVKYEEQISGLEELIVECDLADLVAKEREKFAALREAQANPDTDLDELFAVLENIKFDEAKKVGKREYDDGKFIASLKNQADTKKRLSDAQKKALLRTIQKYSSQVPSFDSIAERFALDKPEDIAEANKDTAKLIALFDQVKEWAEPTKRGKRVYDDKEFVESIASQFKSKGQLSDRQVAAAKRTLKKYAEQIANYEEVIAELD